MKYAKSFFTVFVFGALLMLFTVPAAGGGIGQYWIAVDNLGHIVPGPMSGGTGYPDPVPIDDEWLGQWYFYNILDPAGWYNMWWYDDPYDACRRKDVTIDFFYVPLNPMMPGSIEVTINWSLPEWSQNPLQPPLPVDELFVARYTPSWIIPVPPMPGMVVPLEFFVGPIHLPVDYNPEWVSIDVRGTNFWIMGLPNGYYSEIWHNCNPFTPDIQPPVALIKGDYKKFASTNYCQKGIVNFDGSSSSDDCAILAYNWQLVARNNPANSKSATGKKPAITGLAKDTYDVTLTVTDTSAKTGKATMVLKSCFISTAIDE